MKKIQYKTEGASKWTDLHSSGENYERMTTEAAKREIQDKEWTAFFEKYGVTYRLVEVK